MRILNECPECGRTPKILHGSSGLYSLRGNVKCDACGKLDYESPSLEALTIVWNTACKRYRPDMTLLEKRGIMGHLSQQAVLRLATDALLPEAANDADGDEEDEEDEDEDNDVATLPGWYDDDDTPWLTPDGGN